MFARSAVLVVVVALIGCGPGSGFPKTYPVTGTVKFKGKPVDGAMVTFQLEEGKENAIGTTNTDGEFSLSMFQPNDGAVPGRYRVAVSKLPAAEVVSTALPPGQIASGDLPDDYEPPAQTVRPPSAGKSKSEIPVTYANDQTSGLRATVTDAGPNNFDFDLQ
jgi:hypothetical protein